MASYEASIKVLVEAQQAFRAVKELENRLKNIQDKAAKAQIKGLITESAQDVRRAERRLKAQIDLNAATELYQRRLTQINRAGGARNDQQRKELAGLAKIIQSQSDNVRIVQKVATATGRILEVIRETNRTDKRSNELQSQVRAYQKQFDLLAKQGVSQSKLNDLAALRNKLSDQQSRKELDLAAITKDQLDRKLKLLTTEIKIKQAAEATAAAERSKLQQQGLALRRLARGVDPLISRAGAINAPAGQLALPSSKLLGAEARGLQRIETSEERIARFAQRTAEAKAKSAVRSADIFEANREAAKAGERNAKAAERAAAAEERAARAVRRTTRTRTSGGAGARAPRRAGGGGRAGALATSVGFPLLFGGGPGSIAGGGLGALLGGVPGGILGSAFGQQLDTAIQGLAEFASALKSASISLDDLTDAAGLKGTPTGAKISLSEILGIPEVGRKEAEKQINTVIGEDGIKKFEELGKASDNLGNSFAELRLRLGSVFAPFLTGAFNLGANLLGFRDPETEQERARTQIPQLQQTIKSLETAGAPAAAIAPYKKQLAELERIQDQVNLKTESSLELNNSINKVISDRKALSEAATALEQDSLVLRRDDLAIRKGALDIQKAQNDLTVLDIRLSGELSDAKRQELELEKGLTEERIKQLQAAQKNAQILAERQIEREAFANKSAAISADINLLTTQVALNDLSRSELRSYDEQVALIKEKTRATVSVLEEQNKLDLKGKNEKEVRDAINLKYKMLIKLEIERQNLQLEQRRQQQFILLDQEQQIKNQRELNGLSALQGKESQVRATDPFRAFSFAGAGLGFFAESEKFQADRIAESAAQLELYNRQLELLEDRRTALEAADIDPKFIQPITNQIDDLKQTIDLFNEFQPAIDRAAIAQARFNDAFNAVAPIVSSITGGLQEVVAGTKTAQEAFADFLKAVGDMLVQQAALMIAQYIAIGIARAFAFGGGFNFSGGSPEAGLEAANLMGGTGPLDAGTFGRVDGGTVMPGNTYMVGERGPELLQLNRNGSGQVINNNQLSSAMNRYRRSGSSAMMSPDGTTEAPGGGAAVADKPIDVRYTVERINNVDYVTADQFQQGMRQAAQQGATQGERRTIQKLQMSPGTRRRLGL